MNENFEGEIDIDNKAEMVNTSNVIEINDNKNDLDHDKNEDDTTHQLELTIKLSEDEVKLLKVQNIYSPNKDIYNFCVKNSLDYVSMETIQSQVQSLIKDNTGHSQLSNPSVSRDYLHSNISSNKKIYSSKNKYGNYESTTQLRNNSLMLSNKGSTSMRNKSTKDFKGLFPYQVGITSCRVQKLQKKQRKNKIIKDRNGSYNNHQDYSQLSSYMRSVQEKYHTNPTEDYNPTQSSPSDNYHPLTTSLPESKNVNEILYNQILTTDGNSYYLSNKSISGRGNRTLFQNETINERASKLDKKINYGDLIYKRNIGKKEEKISQIRNAISNNRFNFCTFVPSVNPISKEALNNRKLKQLEYNNPTIISKYLVYSQEKHRILKDKYDMIENDDIVNQCTFTPRVNGYKCTINEQKHNFGNRFDKLYHDNQIKETRLKDLTDRVFNLHPYQPEVNKTPIIKMKFDSRLIDYQKKLSLKKDLRIKKVLHDQLLDPVTNQPLFYPLFESKSIREERKINLDLKTKKQPKDYFNSIKERKCPLNSNSEEIFESKKISSLKKIFKILDSDDDGEISSITMNIKGLSSNLKEILQPLLNEIKDDGETLSEKEFVEICNKLYQILPYDKKKELIEVDGSRKKGRGYLNQTSKQQNSDRRSQRDPFSSKSSSRK